MGKKVQRTKYEALNKSLKEIGQQMPIHRTKFGIVEGYKKAELLVGKQPSILDKVPRFIDHPEVKTIEQHIDLIRQLSNVKMTSEERKYYLKVRASELKKLGVPIDKIVSTLSYITQLSDQYIRRLLPEEYKDMSQSRKLGKQTFPKQNKLISKIRKEYDWLKEKDILEGLKRNSLRFLELAKEHYSTLKKTKIIELDSIELEKVKASLIKEIPSDPNLFSPILEEWEKLHPYKKIIIRDKTREELEDVSVE